MSAVTGIDSTEAGPFDLLAVNRRMMLDTGYTASYRPRRA
jgi:hypothetical protein